MGEGRYGAFPHSGKNPIGCFRERRKKVVERGEVGLSRWDGTGIRRQAGMPHRAVAQKASVLPDLHRKASCRKREHPAVCAVPTLHTACPGPTDHCMLATIQDCAVVCRKICPDKARWEGEGV